MNLFGDENTDKPKEKNQFRFVNGKSWSVGAPGALVDFVLNSKSEVHF